VISLQPIVNPTVCVATTMESQPIEITQLFFSQALSCAATDG
jgi:hypothetical protein